MEPELMDLVTQLGGGASADRRSMFVLKQKLENIGVAVTYPLKSEYELSPTCDSYDGCVSYYESIAACDFHVVFNASEGVKGALDAQMARDILYAMQKRRPIILLHLPEFQADVDLFSRGLIERHLNRMIISDLTVLDDNDLERLLRNLTRKPTGYNITNRETSYARANLRAFFRRFLEPARV